MDAHIVSLAFLFFMWQVPHFWLLLFRFGADYQQAGLPSLTEIFSARQLARLTGIWMLVTAASSQLLPLFFLTYSRWLIPGIAVTGLWLAWHAFKLFRRPPESLLPVFRAINIYALLVMALLIADALLQ